MDKIQHRGVFIEKQLQAPDSHRFICHTGISKFLPDLYETPQQAIEAVDAKLNAPRAPCRSGCGWHLGYPHDRDCPGTAGSAPR